jgi:hypothetical protein
VAPLYTAESRHLCAMTDSKNGLHILQWNCRAVFPRFIACFKRKIVGGQCCCPIYDRGAEGAKHPRRGRRPCGGWVRLSPLGVGGQFGRVGGFLPTYFVCKNILCPDYRNRSKLCATPSQASAQKA